MTRSDGDEWNEMDVSVLGEAWRLQKMCHYKRTMENVLQKILAQSDWNDLRTSVKHLKAQ